MKEIDLTPTWSEWGNLYRRFAESGEAKAVRALRQDHAKAMAFATALAAVMHELPKPLHEAVTERIAAELHKQGFLLPPPNALGGESTAADSAQRR